jgi:hypothetical protein
MFNVPVKTTLDRIKLPPQKWLPRFCKLTIHGCFVDAVSPLTIRFFKCSIVAVFTREAPERNIMYIRIDFMFDLVGFIFNTRNFTKELNDDMNGRLARFITYRKDAHLPVIGETTDGSCN